jgi:hypothetical protein
MHPTAYLAPGRKSFFPYEADEKTGMKIYPKSGCRCFLSWISLARREIFWKSSSEIAASASEEDILRISWKAVNQFLLHAFVLSVL